jgi:hypothetical protein
MRQVPREICITECYFHMRIYIHPFVALTKLELIDFYQLFAELDKSAKEEMRLETKQHFQ